MCKINYILEKGVGVSHALEGFRSPENAFETFKEEKRDSLSANSTRNRGVCNQELKSYIFSYYVSMYLKVFPLLVPGKVLTKF